MRKMIMSKKPRAILRILPRIPQILQIWVRGRRGKQLGFVLPLFILIAVVLVVAGGAGYYFYKVSQEQKEAEVVKPTPIIDETADWNIYNNYLFGYKIKYPDDVFAIIPTPFSDNKNTSFEIVPQVAVTIQIGQNPERLSAIDWIEQTPDDISFFIRKYKDTIETIEINEKECARVFSVTQSQGLPMEQWVHTVIPFETRMVVISKVEEDKSYNLEQIYRQMLYTFDFIDETAGWKIYINEKYGYSFKYPSECRYGAWALEGRPAGHFCFLSVGDPDDVLLETRYTDEKGRLVSAAFSVCHCSTSPKPDNPPCSPYEISLFNPPPGMELVSWLKEHFKGLNGNIPDKPNFEIDRIPAVKVLNEFPFDPPNKRIFFIKNDKLFDITLWYVDSESNNELYNQILSTFKFVELEEAKEEVPEVEEKPYIKVISPNGGERWVVGEIYDITWTAAGVDKVVVDVLDYDVTGGGRELGKFNASLGKFSWKITSDPPYIPGDKLKIRIAELADLDFYDESDNYFSIIQSPSITVTSPNGGEEWVTGKTYDVEWNSTGLDKVTIDLFAYNAEGQVIKGFQHFIAKSIDATRGYYNWTIPEIEDYPNYKLRIYNKLCIGGDRDLLAECLKDRYFDESDNFFSIVSPTVWEALSVCEKISETSDIELRERCVAMVKEDPSACEILSNPETYCYKHVALVTKDSTICEKIKDPGRRGACEALAERVPAKCSEWIYADYCWEEVAALTGDASICDLINYSGGRTDCKAVVLKDVSFCQNSDSEDCYQELALLTGDEEVCEGLKERDDLEWARDLDREVNKCIKMAKREIAGCFEESGTGIDCDMIPVVAEEPSWCEKLEVNQDRCYFYTAMRIADLLPLEFILLRN